MIITATMSCGLWSDIYLGHLSSGATMELIDSSHANAHNNEIHLQVKVLTNPDSPSLIGSIGWFWLERTDAFYNEKTGQIEKAIFTEPSKISTGIIFSQLSDGRIYGAHIATVRKRTNYLGDISNGTTMELLDKNVQKDQRGYDIIFVKIISSPSYASLNGLTGWVKLRDTDLKTELLIFPKLSDTSTNVLLILLGFALLSIFLFIIFAQAVRERYTLNGAIRLRNWKRVEYLLPLTDTATINQQNNVIH